MIIAEKSSPPSAPSGSTIQIPDEKIPEIAEGVMQIAHEISRGLGYTG